MTGVSAWADSQDDTSGNVSVSISYNQETGIFRIAVGSTTSHIHPPLNHMI